MEFTTEQKLQLALAHRTLLAARLNVKEAEENFTKVLNGIVADMGLTGDANIDLDRLVVTIKPKSE